MLLTAIDPVIRDSEALRAIEGCDNIGQNSKIPVVTSNPDSVGKGSYTRPSSKSP